MKSSRSKINFNLWIELNHSALIIAILFVVFLKALLQAHVKWMQIAGYLITFQHNLIFTTPLSRKVW